MISEALNLASVRVELNDIFYQKFNEDTSIPGRATAETGALFHPLQISNAAYIEEIFKGVPLFTVVGESGSVPDTSPSIGNKLTTFVKDFVNGASLSKDWFDDKILSSFALVASFA